MSRIGKAPVVITQGVEVSISEKTVTIKGAKGTLSTDIHADVNVSVKESAIILTPANDFQQTQAFWGLARSVVQNMVTGVSVGFDINLEINGVGYRAAVQGKILKLNLGFSHDVNYEIPEGITIKCPKPTEIIVSGIDKQLVGRVASEIRQYRKPEPYKGKGIKYANERIRRKEGKKK